MTLSNENAIAVYLHCKLCLAELRDDPELRALFSPKEYACIETGFTPEGLQIWCNRHECNIVHIDFEGQRHPANATTTSNEDVTGRVN